MVYRLNGEPKSGTTWFEFINREIWKQSCQRQPLCQYKRKGRKAIAKFDSNATWTFTQEGKHLFNGRHNGGFNSSRPTKDLNVQKGVSELMKNENEAWLPIFRDPRAVLVSSCKHQTNKN